MKMQQILSSVRRAINDFDMIQEGDSIAVGLSGGKDSLTLLAALKAYQRFSPHKFELMAITVDMNFKDASREAMDNLIAYTRSLDVEYHIVNSDIAEILFELRKEKNPCSLCSKLRRGALNTKALELGCNKIALGHHADDLIETFFLSLFYEGRLSTFMPTAFMDRTEISVIRPLVLTYEKNIIAFAKDLPIMKNPCPMDKHTKREDMKNLIKQLQESNPPVKERMLGAIISCDRYNLFDQLPNYILNKNKSENNCEE